jgi:UDP-N-acetylmuramate dehydrogenase
MEVLNTIKKNKIGKIVPNVCMSRYTTFHVGGKVIAIVYPKNVEKLIKLIKILKDENIKYKVLGNGSNVVFSDEDYNGIIINLSELNHLKINI